jgi:hypothetical protein
MCVMNESKILTFSFWEKCETVPWKNKQGLCKNYTTLWGSKPTPTLGKNFDSFYFTNLVNALYFLENFLFNKQKRAFIHTKIANMGQ